MLHVQAKKIKQLVFWEFRKLNIFPDKRNKYSIFKNKKYMYNL